MANQLKLNKRILAACTVVALIAPLLLSVAPANAALPNITLEISINGITVMTLTQDEIQAYIDNGHLTELTGTSSWIKQSLSTATDTYTGVSVLDLCNLVTQLGPGSTVDAIAGDGYAKTFTYDQVVNGIFTTYNSDREDPQPTGGQTLILAYYINGEPLDAGSGPLRAIVIGTPADRYTDSGLANKNVVKLDITNAAGDVPE